MRLKHNICVYTLLFIIAHASASYAEKDCTLKEKTELRYYIDQLAKTPENAQKAYIEAVDTFETLAKKNDIHLTLKERNIDIQRSDDSDTPFYTIEAELEYHSDSIENAITLMTVANNENMDVSLSQQAKMPRGCQ